MTPIRSQGKGKNNRLRFVYHPEDQTPMGNLYITGLPSTLGLGELDQIFHDLGISVTRSKIVSGSWTDTCAALVQVGSLEEAEIAIECLNDKEVYPIGDAEIIYLDTDKVEMEIK